MRPISTTAIQLVAGALVLGLASVANAHGDDMGMDMGMEMSMATETALPANTTYPPTYFAHPEHVRTIYAHIILMTVGWVLILPVGRWTSSRLIGRSEKLTEY
jgi:hypothetical protein